ncbi:MAG: hypothetical protein AAFQ27_02585 [Pseudomonadota bacterium]
MKFLPTKSAMILTASLLFAACSQGAPEGGSQSGGADNDEVVRHAPGEVKNYTFEADEQMMISWRHEGDKDTALACQGEREDPNAFPLPECAGIFQSNGSRIVSGGTYAKGLHGAAVGFKPNHWQNQCRFEEHLANPTRSFG